MCAKQFLVLSGKSEKKKKVDPRYQEYKQNFVNLLFDFTQSLF